jgi:SAM-dependent methyltransferase
MSDYYTHHYRVYHGRTFPVDPTYFLNPLAKHLRAGSTVVDVGCGSGRDILWFQDRGFRVIGVERSSGLAGLARRNTACRIIEADFESYDFTKISADAVVLIGALVHLPHAEFPAVLESVCRALNDPGTLLITMKEGSGSVTDQDGRQFYLWQDKDLRSVFQSQKLKAIDFFRQPSEINPNDTWLGYVLKKA